MRIVFIGSVFFSRRLLTATLDAGGEVAGVICKPRSTFNSDFASLDDVAAAARIPVCHAMSLKSDDVRSRLQSIRPDVIFCFGWSEIIGRELRAIAPRGVVGYHPTLLPLHRGRHPIIWALVHGLSETGSTFFLMDDDADSGPILHQRRVPIDPDMNAGQLYDQLANVATGQIVEVWRGLITDTITATPQDHSKATYWPKRTAADGVIDWTASSRTVHNLIRALAKPYPGATFSNKIAWAARIVDGHGQPGSMLSAEPLVIATGDGAVEITEYEHIGRSASSR